MIINYNLIKDLEDHFRYSNSDCGEKIELYLDKILLNRKNNPYLLNSKIEVYIISNLILEYEEFSDVFKGYEILFKFKHSEYIPEGMSYMFCKDFLVITK